MSSLTDIIFLLLIFFMLTSSLVAPNALNLKFPGKRATATLEAGSIPDVEINSRGRIFWEGGRINEGDLYSKMRAVSRAGGKKAITISPHPNAPVESVATVMDVALKYHINAILKTERD